MGQRWRICVMLVALLCLLLGPEAAWAFGAPSQVRIALLRHGGRFDMNADGVRRLLWETAKRTSVETVADPTAVSATEPLLAEYPVLVWSGDDAFPPLGEAEREGLRRYLGFGGFLVIDDASAPGSTGFDMSVRRELKAILPAQQVQAIPSTHVLYKTFYMLGAPAGRFAVTQLEGVTNSGRLQVLFWRGDLLGAFARDAVGQYVHAMDGGESGREKVIRLGVNTVMYALCLDYKEDQVHIPFLLQRRRQ